MSDDDSSSGGSKSGSNSGSGSGTLDERRVAVTGAARGIGLAIARALHAAGATVLLGDLDAEAVAAAAASVGARASGHLLDVTDEASFAAFLDAAIQDGPLDVLVNNAGVMWVGRAELEPEIAVRRQVEVNLVGVIRGHRLALPAMLARGRGHIVTVASAASRVAAPGESTYSATKHGVLGYTTGLRGELAGSGVEVGIVMPVVVDTELAAGTSHGIGPRLTPEQVADAVLSMIRRPRAQLPVPSYFAVLDHITGLLPVALRERLLRRMLPDQRATEPAARADYERRRVTGG